MWHFPLKEMLISFWFLLPFDLGTATCRDATKRVRDVHADFFHKPSVFMSWKYLLSSGDFQWKKKKNASELQGPSNCTWEKEIIMTNTGGSASSQDQLL